MLGQFLGYLVALPLAMAFQRAMSFRQLGPVEQNLQRAANGAALVILTLLLLFGLYRAGTLASLLYTAANVGGEGDQWIVLAAFVVPLVYGAVRCHAGFQRLRYLPPEPLYRARAFVKLALGIAAAVYLDNIGEPVGRVLASTGMDAALYTAAYLLAGWLVITGAIRLYVTSRPQPGDARGRVIDDIDDNEWKW
jgi:hypothetical protein